MDLRVFNLEKPVTLTFTQPLVKLVVGLLGHECIREGTHYFSVREQKDKDFLELLFKDGLSHASATPIQT